MNEPVQQTEVILLYELAVRRAGQRVHCIDKERTPVYNKGRTRIPITADDIIPLRMLMPAPLILTYVQDDALAIVEISRRAIVRGGVDGLKEYTY